MQVYSDIGHIRKILPKELNPNHYLPYEIPGVERSALIRKNDQIYLCYTSQSPVEKSFFQEILDVFKIGNANILNIDSIPLDDRHNSKINRIALRKLI